MSPEPTRRAPASKRRGPSARKSQHPPGPSAGKSQHPRSPSAGTPSVPSTAAGVRLQKVLAAAGVASRRRAEELIAGGHVSVDGRIVTTLGTRVDPARARVEVDGRRIAVKPGFVYLLLNKPAGYITTVSDPLGRPTVMGLVPRGRRLFPVGRLDADTTGLLLMTDDGELAHRLAHPRHGVERSYVAKVSGKVQPATLRMLERGVRLEDGIARAVRARLRTAGRGAGQVEIVMTEGRKREVRRMLEAVGHPVVALGRVGFGPLRLKGVSLGATRALTAAEVGELYRLVGL